MNKNVKIFFLSLGFLFMTFSTIINIYHDKIEIFPKHEMVKDVYGKESSYTLFTYSQEYKYSRAFAELLYTIGIAIIVYFLIENTLNSYQKKVDDKQRAANELKLEVLHEKINNNVFEGVLKKIIPPDLFDILAMDILHTDIIRKNVHWEYIITKDGAGVRVVQLIMYEFMNTTDSIKNVPLIFTVSHNSINRCEFEYFKLEKMDGTNIVELGANEINPIIDQMSNEQKVIQDISLEAKQTLKVTRRINNIYSSSSVVDCHFTNYPIINLQIRISKPKDLKVWLVPTFTSKLEVEYETEESVIYKPVKGLLTGQAVIYAIEPVNITN